MTESMTLTTDGACLGNPGPGGWAALLRQGEEESLFAGGEPQTTNNRMELLAVIEGLIKTPNGAAVHVITDSQYVMNAFTKGWLTNWQANGWRNASKKPVANKDLWLRLLEQVDARKVSWEWVRGHNGHPDNERVDQAAQEAARRQIG